MTKKHNLHIGKIHADWCSHCISLKKEWDAMKKDMEYAFGRSIKKRIYRIMTLKTVNIENNKGIL